MCAPVLSAITSALGIASSVKSLSASSPKATTISSPTTIDTGKEAIDTQKETRKKAALAAGYQSTMKSGSSGDTSTATTSKKTLLGA